MMSNNSYYGNFRQVKFTDIYDNVDKFVEDYNNIGIKPMLSQNDSIRTLYYLLYAQYANSVVASSDTNRFKYQLFSIVFTHAPTWEKRLVIQEQLRELLNNPAELFAGTTQINNQAYAPGTPPSTSTTDEIEAINQQVVTKYKKDKMSGYAMLLDLLNSDVTTDFIRQFKKLFLTIVQPELPLWYVTEE